MTRPIRQFRIVSAVLLVWAVLILGRLIYLQVFQFSNLSRQARRQQERTIEVSPVRGVIYDRNLHPLAMSVDVESIFAVPGEIPNPEATAKLLAPVLNMKEADLEGRLQGHRFFSWVKRKVSGHEAARVRQLNLQGIYFQKESKRFYPKRELAAHVIGYTGLDDHGLGGVELGYEKAVRGRPGQLMIETDARQHWLGRAGKPPEAGKKLVLTLDENIQYIAERELAVAVEQFRPKAASVIIEDPRTGDILAMANSPTFNPNAYAEAGAEALRNGAVGASYEPGSTFKIVTVAAAIEEKLAQPDERVDCQMGAILLAGHVIHDHKKYGILTVNEIIQNSSDVGAIKLALRMGNDTMYRYLRSFGFGSPTGIELPGEARGLTKPPERWSKISIGAIAMGQEVGVTPLQILTTASVVANGGWWIRPHIVREGERNGQGDAAETSGVDPVSPAMREAAANQNAPAALQAGARRRVISESTAAAMRHMMAMVVTDGTAKSAQLNGYTSAGKTGTAQKIDPATRTYSKRDYVASYVGFAPVESPLFTMLVVFDSPRGKIYGGDVAAPVFKRIAEQILAYWKVPPSLPVKATPGQAMASRGKSRVPAPLPAAAPEEPAEPDTAALLSLDSGVSVPDFAGKTVRAVAEEAQSDGLPIELVGSGIAYRQLPVPGTPLADGQKVKVWFTVGRVPPPAEVQQRTHKQAHEAARQESKPAAPPKTPQQARHLPATPAGASKPGVSKQRPVQSASGNPLSAAG